MSTIYLQRKREQAEQVRSAITALQDKATEEDRDLTADELAEIETRSAEYKTMTDEVEKLTDVEARSQAVANLAASVYGGGAGQDDSLRPYSLVPSPEQILELRSAATEKRDAEVFHARVREDELHVRSTVALTNTGGRVIGVDGRLPNPRRIVTAVGLVPEESDARGGSGARFGATEAESSPGTAEGSTKPEADAITALTIPILPLARWTDITSMAQLSAAGFLDGLASWHAQFVAKDEDRLIVAAVEAAAGSPIGTGNGAADVRTAVAMVTDAVSADADIVLCHPDDYAQVSAFSPTSGGDVASWSERIGPALIYPTSAVDSGTVLVAALRASGRFLVASPPRTASLANLKTNVTTVLTEEHVGFGVRLAGAAVAVDLDASPEG